MDTDSIEKFKSYIWEQDVGADLQREIIMFIDTLLSSNEKLQAEIRDLESKVRELIKDIENEPIPTYLQSNEIVAYAAHETAMECIKEKLRVLLTPSKPEPEKDWSDFMGESKEMLSDYVKKYGGIDIEFSDAEIIKILELHEKITGTGQAPSSCEGKEK